MKRERGIILEDFVDFCKEHAGMYPGFFTIMLLLVFGSPIITAIRLASDPSVQYWISGWFGWTTLLIPVILVICNFYQSTHGPRFWSFFLMTVVPSTWLLLMGYSHVQPIIGVGEQLLSFDCNTFPRKSHIELAHNVAAELFENCTSRVGAEMNITVDHVKTLINLGDCSEYQQYHTRGGPAEVYGSWRKEWKYLQALENEQLCSGWCYSSPALWRTNMMFPDTCSDTAGTNFSVSVMFKAQRLLAFGILFMVLSLVLLNYAIWVADKVGLDW